MEAYIYPRSRETHCPTDDEFRTLGKPRTYMISMSIKSITVLFEKTFGFYKCVCITRLKLSCIQCDNKNEVITNNNQWYVFKIFTIYSYLISNCKHWSGPCRPILLLSNFQRRATDFTIIAVTVSAEAIPNLRYWLYFVVPRPR